MRRWSERTRQAEGGGIGCFRSSCAPHDLAAPTDRDPCGNGMFATHGLQRAAAADARQGHPGERSAEELRAYREQPAARSEVQPAAGTERRHHRDPRLPLRRLEHWLPAGLDRRHEGHDEADGGRRGTRHRLQRNGRGSDRRRRRSEPARRHGARGRREADRRGGQEHRSRRLRRDRLPQAHDRRQGRRGERPDPLHDAVARSGQARPRPRRRELLLQRHRRRDRPPRLRPDRLPEELQPQAGRGMGPSCPVRDPATARSGVRRREDHEDDRHPRRDVVDRRDTAARRADALRLLPARQQRARERPVVQPEIADDRGSDRLLPQRAES